MDLRLASVFFRFRKNEIIGNWSKTQFLNYWLRASVEYIEVWLSESRQFKRLQGD